MKRSSTLGKLTWSAGTGALLFLLSGCTTLAPRSNQVAQDRAALEAAGVDPTLTQKAVSGDALELEEIEVLSARNAPNETIVRAIRRSDAVYRLTTEDIDRLSEAGVEDDVIDALLATPHEAEARPGASYSGYYHLKSRRYYPHRSHHRGHRFHGHHHRYHCY